MKLTSRERIMRIFQNKEIDRPALKLWGAEPNQGLLHPAYKPVCELAVEKSDIFAGFWCDMNIYCGKYADQLVVKEYKATEQPMWQDLHTTFHTPKGDLHGIERISTIGEPSYTMEYMIKEPEDFEKLLSMPYLQNDFNRTRFLEKKALVGDRGIVMISMDQAGYALQRLIGSENLALFSFDCRKMVDEALSVFAGRILDYTKAILETEIFVSDEPGVKAPFMWVGPEVYIPPLMAPQDFEDFIFKKDKPIYDAVHHAGSYVWLHCHGKVANFVERYIDMGVDVLNPLEPPKNGDINLKKIIEQFGSRIGWEGNIEIQDIIQAEPEQLKMLIGACVEAGNTSGRFILCPSAGFMEYPQPSEAYINNLLLYLNHGYECVEACRK